MAAIAALIACAAAAAEPIAAWTPRTERYSMGNGLPDQTVYSVVQDRDGFLWLGTTRGLVRFDGREFRVFRHDPGDPGSLSHDATGQVLIDRQGRLWVGTWGGGVNIVDTRSGRARRYGHADDPASLPSNYVQAMFEDSRGRIWIGTGAGLAGFDDPRGQPFRALATQAGARELNDDRVWSIAEDRSGTLWIATTAALLRYDPDTGAQRAYPVGSGSVRPELLRLVFVDRRDRIWVAGGALLARLDPDSGRFTPVVLPEAIRATNFIVNHALSHDDVRFWLGTWAGVWLFDTDAMELLDIGGSGQRQWFPSDDVRGLLRDRSGLLWVATRYNGLARVELAPPRFRLYEHELGRLQGSFGVTSVRQISRIGTALWLHSDAGLVHADIERGQFQLLPRTVGLRAGLQGTLAARDDGGVWLPTLYGPALLDTPEGMPQILNEIRVQAALEDANMLSVFRDRGNRLWWTTQREGLVVTDLDGRIVNRVPPGAGRAGELADATTTCAHQDPRGRLWFCSLQGLSEMAPYTDGLNTFTVHQHDAARGDSLSHNNVIALLHDSFGNFWVGTQAALDRYDPAHGTFEHYVPDGEDGIAVESIAEGARGELWIASAGRVWRFDAMQRRFIGSPLDPGAAGLAFFARAALSLDSRRILFGTNRGLLLFDSQRTARAPYVPPIAITHAWIDRQPQQVPLAGPWPAPIVVPPGARSLELQFVALDYRDPARNRYAYRLDGFDPDWIAVGPDRLAGYTNLAAGQYRFHVRAAGADEVWNDTGVQIDVRVLPPWWADPTLLTLAASLLLFAIALAVRLHYRRVRLRQQELEQLVDERTRAMSRQTAELESLDQIVRAVNRELDLESLLDQALQRGSVLLPGGMSGAVLLANDALELRLVSAHGPAAATLRQRYAEAVRIEALISYGTRVIDGVYRLRTAGGPVASRLLLVIDVGDLTAAALLFEHPTDPAAFDTLDLDALQRFRDHLTSAVSKALALRQLQIARDAAERATHSKSAFLASMSHEIRTPMNAIVGFSYLGLRLDLQAAARDYFTKIANAGQSLLGIVNDILDFSKIEAGKLELERIEFDLAEVVARVEDLFAQKAAEQGIELIVVLPADVPRRLVGDPLRLGQVLINLVGNALKFTERGEVVTRIELRSRSDAEVLLRFAVQDSGIGIAPEQLERLFQAFSQIDAGTARRFGGTGLGLSISLRLVELMNGQFHVDSTPGVGSTFAFTARFSLGAAVEPTAPPPALQGLRVLVVDDNPIACEVLVEQLHTLGCAADAVQSGEAALATMRTAKPPYRLVLMDWQMPGMDGIETSRRLRAAPPDEGFATIVMVTAHGREEVLRQAGRNGIRGVLLKPVGLQLLRDTLLEALTGARGAATTATQPLAVDPRLAGAQILVVEDNPINQQIAREVLQHAGMQVAIADGGEAAIRMVDQHAYDAVLMDVHMPGMDGYQATRQIREKAQHQALPIIAMTAHALPAYREECLASGMNDFLTKPIEPAQLFAVLGQWLGERVPRVAAPADGGGAAGEVPLAGFDSAGALARLSGNRRLYRRLLSDFGREFADVGVRVRGALADGDALTAERLLHTLKGVAANLGAEPVQQVAGAIGLRLRAHAAVTADVCAELDAVMQRALAQIAALPPLEPAAGQAPPAPLMLAEAVAELRTLLRARDPRAETALERLQAALPADHDAAALARLQRALAAYDFRAAQASLDALTDARPTHPGAARGQALDTP